jgi:hypothetical protein
MTAPLIWLVVALAALVLMAAFGAATLWIVILVIGYAIVMIDLTTHSHSGTGT